MLATYASTSSVEREFSFLQMYTEGRKSSTTSATVLSGSECVFAKSQEIQEISICSRGPKYHFNLPSRLDGPSPSDVAQHKCGVAGVQVIPTPFCWKV